MYFVVKCSECNKFFHMKEIEGDYKMCPSCGKKIKWKQMPHIKLSSSDDARFLSIWLNEKEAQKQSKKYIIPTYLDPDWIDEIGI